MDTRPIGVFDSGFGGVSVLREAVRRLPTENYIYYGDNKNAPYGDKTYREIGDLAFACADYLISKNVKIILLACNTATGVSINKIRQQLSIPVVSIEPAIKPACSEPGDGIILMLATKATTELERYRDLQSRMPDPDRVINVACPGLVDRIESGRFGDDDYDDILENLLYSYEGQKVDGIVLGCTHYVFIRNAISKYSHKHFIGTCKLFDGNAGTVQQLGRVLQCAGIANDSGNANVEFHSSSETSEVHNIFSKLMSLPYDD